MKKGVKVGSWLNSCMQIRGYEAVRVFGQAGDRKEDRNMFNLKKEDATIARGAPASLNFYCNKIEFRLN